MTFAHPERLAVLILKDGMVFYGEGFGAKGKARGEVVFNTGMSGYQEVFSDPSYKGQIVVMTSAHIGNVGVNERDNEDVKPALSGVAVYKATVTPSNYRAEDTLDHYLERHGVVGISGVDQRAITLRVRNVGAMPGLIAWPVSLDEIPSLKEQAKSLPGLEGIDLVRFVSKDGIRRYEPPLDEWTSNKPKKGYAVVIDLGVKRSILDCLCSAGYVCDVCGAKTPASDIMAMKPDIVVLSNGPGDPSQVTYAIDTAKRLLGKVKLFGICLGHQILALAMGAKTYKLKFGHHGTNHPVRHIPSSRILITSQNHGFAVLENTLPKTAMPTFVSLNDGTLEGFDDPSFGVKTVQFHPEGGPGPHDARFIFDSL